MAHNIAAGTDSVMIPQHSETGAEYGLAQVDWFAGLASWVVATAR
ncbi:hypothetical protein [Cellulomonas sp. URHD0024]|nr:hypothetical protein [Cellulomonas sp. URHD0024]